MNVKHNSHLTAISRKTLPVPTRWLIAKDLIAGKVMDYGCGKCHSINPLGWHNYDPYHCPTVYWSWSDHYNTVICNYVLCTLPEEERLAVLQNLQRLLTKDGTAYISVRADKPKQGWGKSSRGTYQGRARKLPLPLVYKNSQFRIYQLTKTTKLVG